MDFKEKMKVEIIPWVESMLEKERQHMAFLEMHKKVSGVQPMLDHSKSMVAHFEQRLTEYKNYANGNGKLKR